MNEFLKPQFSTNTLALPNSTTLCAVPSHRITFYFYFSSFFQNPGYLSLSFWLWVLKEPEDCGDDRTTSQIPVESGHQQQQQSLSHQVEDVSKNRLQSRAQAELVCRCGIGRLQESGLSCQGERRAGTAVCCTPTTHRPTDGPPYIVYRNSLTTAAAAACKAHFPTLEILRTVEQAVLSASNCARNIVDSGKKPSILDGKLFWVNLPPGELFSSCC